MGEFSGASRRYVLGVNPGPHDSSAALLRDGELVAMVEQERLSRRRHAFGEGPRDAITACLAHEGIDIGVVDEIAVGWDKPTLHKLEGADSLSEPAFMKELLGVDAPAAAELPRLRFVEHHVAHAASAFYTSGLKEAAILVADGRGESIATTIASGGPGGIEVLRTWGVNQSLGHLYGTAAAWAGLTVWGAGKLMGLAAYGRPRQPVPLAVSDRDYAIVGAPSKDGERPSRLLGSLGASLVDCFEEHNYPFRPGTPADVMAHADFAASIQAGLEEAVLGLARMARRETDHRQLVLGGGIALNCAANGTLIRSGSFDEVWIPPFPNDAGVSLGAALVANHAANPATTPPRLPHALWAPETGEPDDDALAQLSDCEVSRYDDAGLAEAVARHLHEGRLVGWWQGRAEVGHRALGARSILCDPRSRGGLVRTNAAKGREGWRPLAPAVLAEHADALFEGSLPVAADFMLAAWPVRDGARALIPAAVHVDGSTRPQIVRPTQSRFHATIRAFHERTGVPAVINTSFNLAGEPIVLSAADAVRAFLNSDLDVLALGDMIARKRPNEQSAEGGDHRRKVRAEALNPLHRP